MAASWSAVSGATKYLISVYDSTGVSLQGAPYELTGTSFASIPSMTLTPSTAYKLSFQPYVSGAYLTDCPMDDFTTTA